MKYFLLFILLTPLFAVSQDRNRKLSENVQDSLAGTSFVIKNNEVIFSKIYESKLKKKELLMQLKSFLPNIGNFEYKIDASDSTKLNGILTGNTVNYRKFGGTLLGTYYILNSPIYGNVVIQVRDYKYRVLITNLNYKNAPAAIGNTKIDFVLDDGVTKNKRTEFRTNNNVVSWLTYMDKHFIDVFNIQTQKTSDNF